MIQPDTVVTVLMPLCDDADCLRMSVERTLRVLAEHCPLFEVVLVDDDSRDATAAVAEELLRAHAGLRLICLARRYGREVAVTAGLEAALGDVVVVLRPRFDPPEVIPALVDRALATAGVVLGVTPMPNRAGLIFRWCRRGYYWMLAGLVGAAPPLNATGLCALTRPVVNAVTQIKSRHRHLRLLAYMVGYPVECQTYVPLRVEHRPRGSLARAINEALTLALPHSKAPLRIASLIGIIASGLNLAYVVYVVAVNLFRRDVAPGWTTLSLQNAGMFFFVFLNLVLISEYVAQTLEDVQERPLYHVRSERCSDVSAARPAGRNVLDDSTAPRRRGGKVDAA